jgi:hypothetical protein
MNPAEAAVLFTGGVLVLVVALCVVALGAWAWGRAAAAMVQARAHDDQAQTNRFIMADAQRAVEETPDPTTPMPRRRAAPPPPPSDLDLVSSLLAQREEEEPSSNGQVPAGFVQRSADELDTNSNAGIEEPQQGFGGSEYRL